jgi:Na+/H+ antiporter NhaC
MAVQKKPFHILIALLAVTLGAVALSDAIFAQNVSEVVAETAQESATTSSVYGTWLSILPPLVAIAFALIFRQVLFALFIGIWMGAWLGSDMSILSLFPTFFASLTDYVVPSTADEGHMSIIIFTILIGGMVGVITDNGGTRGVIHKLSSYVKTKIHGQILTAIIGFLVFFDDYANTMVVGNTMRPLTDRLKISRAKLAYLVDSTAAPVATLALISTWIGAMVGYIGTAEEGIPEFTEAAYSVFINSLPYNFYAFFTLIFVLMIAASGRDFGPMLQSRIDLYKAEKDPKLDKYNLYKEHIEKDEARQSQSHWLNAAIPILILIGGVVGGLLITGEGEGLQDIIASADSYAALLWGSLFSLVVAIGLTIAQKLLTVNETLEGMFKGMHVMFDGLLVLVLAWALSQVTYDLGTADYLVSVFGANLNPFILPAIVFVLSAATAFATGSSWGTMGILMPLVLPLVWSLGIEYTLDTETISTLMYASVSAVLAGSVWGDHSSPISDTTILSSLATQCDHVEHVNTQLPYALVGGLLSIGAYLAVIALGLPWWAAYVIGIAIIWVTIRVLGKSPDPAEFS